MRTTVVAPTGRMPPRGTTMVWSSTLAATVTAVDLDGRELEPAEPGDRGVELEPVDRAAGGVRDRSP